MKKIDVTGVLSASSDGVRLRVKVVPGASRTEIAGVLGDRLKVQVAAPPEGGRANQALCELLADVFGAAGRDVIIESGHTEPRKSVVVIGLSLCKATEILERVLAG